MPTLRPPRFADDVATAVLNNDARTLATYLSYKDHHCRDLVNSTVNIVTLPKAVEREVNRVAPAWGEIFEAHGRAIVALQDTERSQCPDFVEGFNAQKQLVSEYNRLIRTDPAVWTLPVMYLICRELRELSIQADAAVGGKDDRQREAARITQAAFTTCCTDRTSPLSRKQGVKYMATLLFKTYFRVDALSNCKQLIANIEKADLPPSMRVPRSHDVAFFYYLGLWAFLHEEYAKAEEYLDVAARYCNRASTRNLELILTYLIPLKLYRGKRLLSPILARFGRLSEVYRPLGDAIAYGNIREFDRLLLWAEPRLLGQRTYLLVERCRDICLTNTVRLVHHIENRESKLSFEILKLIASYPGELLETATTEDVECVLANLISQDRVKGYLSHGNATLVLSKARPFNPPLSFANDTGSFASPAGSSTPM